MLWNWFILSTFELSPLTTAQAIGIAMLIKFLTYQYVDTQPEDEYLKQETVKIIIYAFLRTLFILCFGWIVAQFI